MYWWNMQPNSWFYSQGNFWAPFLLPAVFWSLLWKGLALYKAARNEQKGWYIVLLVVNTLGILEIVYLLLFSNLKPAKKKTS